MTIRHLLTRTVTIRRAGSTTDRYNNAVAKWEAATSTTVAAWVHQPAASEVLDGRNAQISDLLVYLPAGTAVSGSDRLVIDGTAYEIVGPPNRAHGSRGEHHIELTARAVTG